MMGFTDGTVIAILPQGFRIHTKWDTELDCRTMNPGHELELSVGDAVHVLGGPDAEGGFATSSIYRKLANGDQVEVFDRPRSSNDVARSTVAAVLMPATRPRDFSVTRESYSPPLPPPHSWEQVIRIGPEPGGEIQLIADCNSPKGRWTLSFPLYDTHLDWLYDALTRTGALATPWRMTRDVPVGGGARSLTIKGNGQEIQIPPFVVSEQQSVWTAAFSAVDALVPAALIAELEKRRMGWVEKRR